MPAPIVDGSAETGEGSVRSFPALTRARRWNARAGGRRLGRTRPGISVRLPARDSRPLVRLAALITSAAALLTLAGSCGLETIPYLAPPTSVSLDVANVAVSFKNDPANDVDYFSGYEIYYRLYTSTADAATAESAIASSTTPGISLLTSYGYRRVTPQGESFQGAPQRPLIEFSTSEKSQPLTVTLTFLYQASVRDNPTATWSGVYSPVILRRDTDNPDSSDSNSYKRFFVQDYTQSDGDIQGSYSSGQDLYIVLVAVAYGTDISTLQAVYSTPVVLISNANLTYYRLPVSSYPQP